MTRVREEGNRDTEGEGSGRLGAVGLREGRGGEMRNDG